MPILPGLIANSGGSQPSPPTGLFSSATTVNSFTLNWTTPEFLGKIPLVRYVVLLYDSSGSLINSSHKTVNYPANTVVVDGLAEGTTYSVRMRLENSVGIFSELSASSGNITTAVTPPPPPPPPSGGGGTTWFCSQNDVDQGATSFISGSNESGSRCDSYAISCSTSGFPGTPAIPNCSTGPPPGEPSCIAGDCGPYGSYSACSGGSQFRTRLCTRANCTTYTQTQSRSCCTASCGAWGSWVRVAQDGEQRFRTCTRTDCSTYIESQTRCYPSTRTSCGSCSRTRPFRQTCTTTTVNSDCTTSQTSSTRSCT